MRPLKITLAFVLIASAANAQSSTTAAARADSARTLRSAKSAQIRFESRRRFLAPSINVGSKGLCQTIGRFCRHASGIAFSQIPGEPDGTTRARDEMLRTLAAAAVKIPGDSWIAGQRVRYLIESGNDSAAQRVAAGCKSEDWWCDALAALTAHASNRFEDAETLFSRALNEMPEAKRCEWTNLSELLDGDALAAYEKLDCAARAQANERIWWLTDPLFSTPGNERRTEHYARHVWAEIDRGGTNGFGMSWAADMMEMIVRFGWAEKWTQQPPSGLSDGSPSYVAHEREPDFHFIPSVRYDAPLETIGDSSWNLSEENPREGYSPRYASAFISIEPELSRFRRGDSTLIVAAFDVTSDTAWKYIAVRPALVIAPSDTSRFLVAAFDSTPRRSAVWMTVPSRTSLASVELLSLDAKVAGRWRNAVKPLATDTSRQSISDLLLFDAGDSLATGIDGAIAAALGKRTIGHGTKVGVYWETYGEADDSARAVSLTLTPIAPGLVTRVLRSFGVGKTLLPVALRWRDASSGSSIQSRSVLLDISQIAPGRYELRLTSGEGAGASSASRPITIER